MVFAVIFVPFVIFTEPFDCNSTECIKFVSFSDNFLDESNAIYCSDSCEKIESNEELLLYVNKDIASVVDMQAMLHEIVRNIIKEDGILYSRFKGQSLNLRNLSIYFRNNTDTPLFKGSILIKLDDFASPVIEITSDVVSARYEYYFQKDALQKTFVGKYKINIPKEGWSVNQIFKDYEFLDQFPFDADKFKITGEIETFIFMRDLEGYYFRISNANILDIDGFMKGGFTVPILKEMDIPINKHGVKAISFDLNIFNEVVEFENIKVDSNFFQLSGGRIVIEDGEITAGSLPVVPERLAASKFFKFLHDKIAEFKGFTINLSGDYIQPEIMFDARDSIIEFFSRRLSEKPAKPDEEKDYSESTYNSYINFKKEFDTYFDSENQDLSTISFASAVLLFEDKSTWEKIKSLKITDEWMTNELNFLLNKINLFSAKPISHMNSVVLSRVSDRFYRKYYENNKDKYLELAKINNWPQFDKKFNLNEYISDVNAGLEDLIDIEDMENELRKIDMSTVVGELPIESAVMLIAVPQVIKGTGKIAYKIEKKILKQGFIEAGAILKDFAIRQSVFQIPAGEIVYRTRQPLEMLIHGNHRTGHTRASTAFCGSSMKHVHEAMDMGGGWLHRTYNHDITAIFNMGKRYGLKGCCAATHHLIQDFFTKDGVRIFPPGFLSKISGWSPVKNAKNIKRVSKIFSINSVRFMNGVVVALFGYDLAKTTNELVKVYKKYGGKYFLTRKIRIMIEQGIPIITKPVSYLGLPFLIKRVPVITLSGILNAALYGWLAYDIYEYYKSYVFINEISKPEKRYAEVRYSFGDHSTSLKHSRRFFQEKDKEYMFHLNTCSNLIMSEDNSNIAWLNNCKDDIQFLIDNDKSDKDKPAEIELGQATYLKKAFLHDLKTRIHFAIYQQGKCSVEELYGELDVYKKYISEINLSPEAIKKGWFDSEKKNLDDLTKKTKAVIDYLIFTASIISQNKDREDFQKQKNDLISTINNLHKYIMAVDEHFKNKNSTEEAKEAIVILEEFRVFRERFLKLYKN
jgi:hypothetical protein